MALQSPMTSYDIFPKDGTPHELPCGQIGYWEGTGWRCGTCMTIYGSMACPCEEERPEDGKPRP